MPSCIASSFSQGDAFISSKPLRTMTFTSSPPSRREVRQQSIAVLPPPSTMTRLPIWSTWPNETLDSQSMPIWMLAPAFLAAGNVELAPARRARADEDRVVALGQQRLQAVDALAEAQLDAHVGDVAAFLVDDRFGQAEARDLGAHHAAGLGVAVEHDEVVAQRRQVARHGERGRAGADRARRACRSSVVGDARQAVADVVLVVGGDALQAADRDRLLLDPAAPAGRLARAVAGAAENAGKDVRLPIDHVGVGVAPGGDQADIFGHRRMRRAGPLAIDDLVEIVGRGNIGRLQRAFSLDHPIACDQPFFGARTSGRWRGTIARAPAKSIATGPVADGARSGLHRALLHARRDPPALSADGGRLGHITLPQSTLKPQYSQHQPEHGFCDCCGERPGAATGRIAWLHRSPLHRLQP